MTFFTSLRTRSTFTLSAIALAGLMLSPRARADEPTRAETLFNEGRDALAAHQYDVACAKFRESDRLDAAVGTHLNLANCEEQRGHVAEARILFREALEQLAIEDPRSAVAKARIQALDARVPRLTIRSQSPLPVGTELAIATSSLDLGATQMPLLLDPGTYQLRVSVPKHRVATYLIELREGQSVDFAIPPAENDQKPSGPRASAGHQERAGDWSSLQWTGAGAIAGGAVVFGVGGYVLLSALSKNSDSLQDCSGDWCGPKGYDSRSSAVSRGNTATALALVGTVLVGGGVALWLVGRGDAKDSESASHASSFQLRAAPMGLGGQVLGRF